MRLIDADALTKALADLWYDGKITITGVAVADLIANAPTVERHGKWLPGKQVYYYMPNDGQEYPAGVTGVYVCSVCEEVVKEETNYCPNCGAKMEE